MKKYPMGMLGLFAGILVGGLLGIGKIDFIVSLIITIILIVLFNVGDWYNEKEPK